MRFMDRIHRLDTAPMGAVESFLLNTAAVLFGIAAIIMLVVTY